MKIPISEAALSLGFTGGTKEGELQRTAEVLIGISEREQGNGPYYIIALLYDIGYGREDVKRILEILRQKPGGVTRQNKD